jgi:predicted enzyme related to lactoylglutathione lyase
MIRWVYAFLDRPKEHFDQAAAFWTAVTGTSLSARRGADGEFSTLLPAASGRDACVKIQGIADGPGGAHLDLAVEDVRALARRATDLGARVLLDEGDLVVLASPTGHLFCAVRWNGEAHRPDVFEGTRLDQLCLDVAPDQYEAAKGFWAQLTDWPVLTGRRPEFSLVRPGPELPIRILLQRLDSPADPVAAHLDFACADSAATRTTHERLGATHVADHPHWTVMRDPTGAPYCLTARDPETGKLR